MTRSRHLSRLAPMLRFQGPIPSRLGFTCYLSHPSYHCTVCQRIAVSLNLSALTTSGCRSLHVSQLGRIQASGKRNQVGTCFIWARTVLLAWSWTFGKGHPVHSYLAKEKRTSSLSQKIPKPRRYWLTRFLTIQVVIVYVTQSFHPTS